MLAMCTLGAADEADDARWRAEPVSRPVLFGGVLDSDGDGIPDEAETNGVAGEPLLDFPTYGADPGVADVFVQADWVGCDPQVEFCGVENSLDFYQVSSRVAASMASYYAPDIAIHVDNGVPAPDPSMSSIHGAWGGAHRLPPQSEPCSADSLGPRYGYFHRGSHRGYGGGGTAQTKGFCLYSDSGHGSVSAHELGHNLGLGHGGTTESYAVNCKPHYRSPMNYGYLYDRTVTEFSRGANSAPLNAEFMDEIAGLGDPGPEVLASLESSLWALNVREDGAIDWNRNGVYESDVVRAPVTWGSASCEPSFAHSDGFEFALEPTLTWVPASDSPQLYMFSRAADTGVPQYRVATSFTSCDLRSNGEGCGDWQPSADDPARPVPDALAGVGAVAAIAWADGDHAQLLLVYGDQAGQLHAQSMARAADGIESWGQPVALGPDARTDGSPALLLEQQRVLLVAPLAARLLSWERSVDDAEFVDTGEQLWDTGVPILPCYGPALARGYLADSAGPETFALVATGPFCSLDFARRDADGTWQRLTEHLWADGSAPMVGGRPGLAYVPYTDDPAHVAEGRFYVAYTFFPVSAAVLAMTQGNDRADGVEQGQLALLPAVFMRNVWGHVADGITLLFDTRFDRNLRSAWTYAYGDTYFSPFADGIFGVDSYDVDDYQVMRASMACSLTRSCP